MTTLRLYADPAAFDPAQAASTEHEASRAAVAQAAAILRAGGTVAFATETVYGLGANAFDPHAVAKIFLAKQRPAWDPLIVHVADQTMLAEVAASLAPVARVLIRHFWPGALTLLVPRSAAVPDAVTAGRPLVAVRMPAHPVARELILAAGVPIAAPSANTFGHVSPTTAAHVAADLDGRIDAILDSGPSTQGLESAVLDTSVDPCVLYRPGSITLAQLRAVWPRVEAYVEAETRTEHAPAALPSPGVGLRHYAPRARLVLVEGRGEGLEAGVAAALNEAAAHGQSAGLMLPSGIHLAPGAAASYNWGDWSDPPQLAQRLFAGLRCLDDAGVQVIVCPLPPAQGLGVAIVDRLRKAARRG